MSRLGIAAALLGALSVGCAGEEAPTTDPLETMVLRTVDWNPAKVDVGGVSAVVDAGDTSYLFGQKGVTLMTGGAPRAQIPDTATWVAAAAIPSADGTGTWVVGLTDKGKLLRVRASMTLEDVGERWGLEKDVVKSVAALDETRVAFGLAGGFALSDGKTVTRYEGPASGVVRGGGKRLAFVGNGVVRVVSVPAMTALDYPMPTAVDVAIDARGLVVTATDGLWVERGAALVLRVEGAFGPLSVAGKTTWTATGGELVTLSDVGLAKSTGAALDPGAKLFGAPNGDLWIAATSLRRVSYGTASAALADWTSTMQPIYAKVCSGCHAPGGTAGLDLSSYAAWVKNRARIQQAVVVDKTMPPKSRSFSDEDRAAVGAWIARNE